MRAVHTHVRAGHPGAPQVTRRPYVSIHRRSRAEEPLRLRLLGPVRCAHGAGPSRSLADHPHTVALLGLLSADRELACEAVGRLLFGQPDTRPVLDLLDATERTIGPGWIRCTGNVLSLGGSVESDLEALMADFRNAQYAAVTARPGGDFLEGTSLPPGAALNDQVASIRSRVRWIHDEARARDRTCRIMGGLADTVLVRTASGRLVRTMHSSGREGGPDLDDAAFVAQVESLCATVCADAVHEAVFDDQDLRMRMSIVYLKGQQADDAAFLIGVRRQTDRWPSKRLLQQELGLTAREARVALLLAEGRTNAEIAKQLFISPYTAKRHTENILAKLSLRSRAAVAGHLLAIKAQRCG